MSKPGSLASAANLAIFWSICVVACSHYGLKQLKSSFQSRSTPEKDERKKLIVISGCDRGIGRLLAEKLQQSTEYIALALTLTKEAAQELKDLQIYSFQCNVTSEKDVKAMKAYVETIVEKEKAVLYTIVNNAGIADPGDFAWFPDINIHKRVMDVNYFGQLRVTQALLPIMLRTTPLVGGRILNMSSVCGTSASPANSAYNAS
jgi:3-oxoacyl-[acyl-carrier protein] reductase